MSYNINDLFVARNSRSGYQIEQSLRFNNESENVYLSKTFSSDGNRKKWTWSAWVKLGRVSDEGHVFEAYTGSGDNEMFMRFNSNDSIRFGQFTGSAYDWKLDTTAKFRDPSAWYHVVLVFDSDNATSSDRARIYVNGERVTAFDSPTYPASGANGYVNKSGYPHYLCNSGLTTRDFGGYLAEVNFIDGVAVTDALDFGEYDDNGVWRPIKYTGSYTGNSFYLKFVSGDGTDSSGNGNNWTASGLATTDVVLDTPTNNFATYNHLSKSNFATITLSEGNLKSVNSSNSAHASSLGTIFVNSGKWYCEFRSNAAGDEDAIGIFTEQFNTSANSFYNANFIALLGGALYYSTYRSYAGSDFGSGDIVRMKLDLDNQTVGWAINGGSFNDVDITSFDSHSAGEYWTFGVRNGSSGGDGTHNISVNFGQDSSFAGVETRQNNSDDNGKGDFYYDPPTGFLALCTANLPAPDIADGSDYFTTLAYSGTSTTDSKVIEDSQGDDWAPDFVWLKKRNSGANNMLYDRVRGASKSLRTNTNDGEVTGATNGDLTAFTSTGFTLNSGNDVNASGNTYVAWNWLAGGGSGSSNTDGTITSMVSANPTAGFSIGTFTGTGSAGSIGHGLGNPPKFILIKRTNVSGNSWAVYHDSVGSGKQLLFNSSNAVSNDGAGFSSAPTSSVINVGSGSAMDTNQVGAHVFYAFAEVEGYSKFGSYTGNGSSNGPFLYCGFRPAWVMIKRTDSTQNWPIVDSIRDSYNIANRRLFSNLNSAEDQGITNYLDLLSNGFKCRDSNVSYNASGGTYIFVAFAENPLGGDGVSPATAR